MLAKKITDNAIVGYGDHRSDRDFYPTPPEATQALINYLQIPKDKVIWECACGSGRMVDVLEKNGYTVVATDIAGGYDFLMHEEKCDWIITNPPFFMADKFINRAADLGVPFAFLLKSQYWHSKKRLTLFDDHTPSAILPLTWRPDFTGQGGSLMDMIWCVWDGSKTTVYRPLEKPVMGVYTNG